MEEKNIQNSEWHLSKYNLFGKELVDNLIPCVNLMRGTYSELSIDDVILLQNIDNIDKDSSLFKCLVNQGIIVNFNEQEVLKSMAIRENSRVDTVKITIAVTMACNFNCPYCFEIHKPFKKMSLETEDKIIQLIKKLLILNKGKKLELTWYGGEPLLASDTIKSLSNKLLPFLEKENIFYKSNIITNGYFFNQKNVDILEEAKVTKCQITLDGLKNNHDSTRHLISGGSTFDVIINNLKNIKFTGQISIRHNVNEKNKEDVEKLRELIAKISRETGNNIYYYSAILVNNPAEIRKEKVEYLNNLDKTKIGIAKDIKNFSHSKPFFCSAQGFWSYCIDNEGYLYKCWEDVGKIERSFGEINTWEPTNPFYTATNADILTKYINSAGIFEDLECKECIWVPLCAGGCASKRFFCDIKCMEYKNNPDEFISKVATMIRNRNKNNSF